MAEDDKLPTIWQVISDWLGVQLPTISAPLPQTRKNFDKALSKIVLAVGDIAHAVGENVGTRIRRSTASIEGDTEKAKAVTQIAIEKMFRSAEEQRKIANRALVLKAAHDDLQSSPPETDARSEIEDDWLNFFARMAEDKSSAELQRLFGKILSGEVRRPGSFSLRTLQIMTTISKSEAEKVSHLLSYAINAVAIPFETGADHRPNTDDHLFLEDVGIAGHPVRDPAMGLNATVGPHSIVFVMATNVAIVIRNNTSKELKYYLESQPLTTCGRELVSIANPPPTDVTFVKKVAETIYGRLRARYATEMRQGEIVVEVASATRVGPDEYKYERLFSPGETP